jgi:hypothetical protein
VAVGQASELLLWELGETAVRPIALEPVPLGAGWLDAAAWQPRGMVLAVAAGPMAARCCDRSDAPEGSHRLSWPGAGLPADR